MGTEEKGGEVASTECPICHSDRFWRDGTRKTEKSSVQRFVCRDCGHRFSESSVLSTPLVDSGGCQVCAPLMGAKNLAKVEPPNDGLAGATGQTKTDKATIFDFSWWMKKQGYSDSTIETRVKLLRILSKRGADLHDSDSVKESIAGQEGWCNKRKSNAVDAYTSLLIMIGGNWNPPRYRFAQKLPFIPLESEIDALIAGTSHSTSAFLQLMKETGARCGEIEKLKWTDIDFETGNVRITPEKGSNPRILRISSKTFAMLNNIPRISEWVFGLGRLYMIRRTYQRQRKKLAYKLGNPRLNQIKFHTFRHWKGTILYHQTHDIYYVMRFLGHKNINNTMIYIQLEEALFNEENEEYVCKVAATLEETKQLIEAGFEHVCDFNGNKVFRKRK